MKYYLITGGSGFVGRHLIKKMILEGKLIINIDIKKPKKILKNETFIQHNIEKEFKIPIKLNNIIAVVHLAAQTSSIISEENPKQDLMTNVIGISNILEFSRKKNIPILFSSSMVVYGNKNNSFLSIYGISKKFSESLLVHHNEQVNKVTILRLFNVYGPGQNLNNLKQGMVSIFAFMAIKYKKIQINGTLTRSRDFMFISDVVDQIDFNLNKMIISKNKKYLKICDVRSGKTYTVKELINKIVKICKINWNYEVKIKIDKGFKNDVNKIKKDYSFYNKKNIDLDKGLNLMLKWIHKEIYD